MRYTIDLPGNLIRADYDLTPRSWMA